MKNETVRLAKAPSHTTRGGLYWGAWDGHLAIVDIRGFDTETMERCYVVRFAVDVHTREPLALTERALERAIGLEVRVRNPHVPYEQTVFEVGNRVYNPSEYIQGTFAPPIEYRVKLSLSDMTDEEHYALLRSLRARGFMRIETRRTAKQIKAMLARSFAELQDEDEADEAHRILLTIVPSRLTDEVCDTTWKNLRSRGVYTETRAGRVKWLIQPLLGGS
jgi:hypothetical protein